jgi:hypothetical protein
LAASFGCAIFTLLGGKNQHWDLLNYHYYAGFSVVNDRLESDLFAASIQSYLNPTAYLPFYWMVKAGLPDWVIGLTLALFVSLALWAIIELAALVTHDGSEGPDWLLVGVAAALAFVAPVFLAQVGSTFADATTSVLVLWGYVLLLRKGDRTNATGIGLAGVLLGAALALKPTNLPFVLASVCLVGTGAGRKVTIQRFCVLAAACSAAVLIVASPWAWRLLEAFGNPVFPLMNGWFRSDAFAPVNFSHTRYLPATLQAALSYPLDIVAPKRYVYTETVSPDLRFLVVFLLIGFAALVSGLRLLPGIHRASGPVAFLPFKGSATSISCLKKLTLAFCVSWVLWLLSSGNGRYFMPMVLLGAVLVVGWICFVIPARSWRYLVAGLVLALQVWLTFSVSNLRWTPVPWTGRWFDIEVPPAISGRPLLVLSADTQSNSFLVPFLHPDSSFVNTSGQFALGPGYPGWSRLEPLLSTHAGAIYFLFDSPLVDGAGKAIRPPQARLDASSARFGFRVDAADCEDVLLREVPSLQLATTDTGLDGALSGKLFSGRFVVVCPAIEAPEMKFRYLQDVENAKPVFSALERRCPKDFFPPTAAIEGFGSLWWRNYVNTDGRITISNGVVRVGVVGKDEMVIGKVAQVLDGSSSFACFSSQGNGQTAGQ